MDLTAFYRVPDKPKPAGNKKDRRKSALDVLADARSDVENRTATLRAQLDLAGCSTEGDPRNWVGEVVGEYDDQDFGEDLLLEDEEEEGQSYKAVIDRLIRKQEATAAAGTPRSRLMRAGSTNLISGGGGVSQSFTLPSPSSGSKSGTMMRLPMDGGMKGGGALQGTGSPAVGSAVNVAAAAAAAVSPFNRVLPVRPMLPTPNAAEEPSSTGTAGPRAPGAGRVRRGSVDMSMMFKDPQMAKSTGQLPSMAKAAGGSSLSPPNTEPLPILAPRAPGAGGRARRGSVDMNGVSAAIASAMARMATADPFADLHSFHMDSSLVTVGSSGLDSGSGKLPIWLSEAAASNTSTGNGTRLKGAGGGSVGGWEDGPGTGTGGVSSSMGQGKEAMAGRRAGHSNLVTAGSGPVPAPTQQPVARNGRRASVMMV